MRQQQDAVLTALRRAQQFLDAHTDVLAAVNSSTRKQLDDVVTQLSSLSLVQAGGTRGSMGETAKQLSLRATLRRNYMAPIAELAKYKLRDVPEFAALMLPPANGSLQNEVAAASAMADAASAHAQTFVDNGLPATFVADFRTATATVAASTVDRSTQLGRRTGATAGLGAEEKRGRAVLRVLNALIMATAGADAQLIGEWTSAKLVRRKPGPTVGAKATGTATTPVTPTLTATTTATAASPAKSAASTPATPTPKPVLAVAAATATPAPTSTPVAAPVAAPVIAPVGVAA